MSLLTGSSNISPTISGYNGDTSLGYDYTVPPALLGYDHNVPSTPLEYLKTDFNTINKSNMQVKLAVFKVERDEKGDIKSSTFLKEFWVEKLPNVSIELLAVKELEPDFNPKDIVIKEILTVRL